MVSHLYSDTRLNFFMRHRRIISGCVKCFKNYLWDNIFALEKMLHWLSTAVTRKPKVFFHGWFEPTLSLHPYPIKLFIVFFSPTNIFLFFFSFFLPLSLFFSLFLLSFYFPFSSVLWKPQGTNPFKIKLEEFFFLSPAMHTLREAIYNTYTNETVKTSSLYAPVPLVSLY